LSIPYDKGWTIKVNGIESKPLIISRGMMGLALPKGKNTIELTFKHLYIQKGIVLSIGALIALISILLMAKKRAVKPMASSDI